MITVVSTTLAELLELSYTFNVDAPNSPSLKNFEHSIVKKGKNKFGNWVELNNFCSSEHSGTHLDAPVHFNRHGWSVSEIPTERLYRVPGVMIDVSRRARSQSNYEIKTRDLERWESSNGIIPDGAVVLINTGWGQKSSDIQQYSGLDEHNKLNFPGLSVEAAEWLATHGSKHGHDKGILGVGIDTISVDVGQSVRYPAHIALARRNLYNIENVANTYRLPPTGFILTILPVRIGGGSGAPARILAELNGSFGPAYSASTSHGVLEYTPHNILLFITLALSLYTLRL